jgi:hypothetical protein
MAREPLWWWAAELHLQVCLQFQYWSWVCQTTSYHKQPWKTPHCWEAVMHYLTAANQYKTSFPFVIAVLLIDCFSLLIFYYFALISETQFCILLFFHQLLWAKPYLTRNLTSFLNHKLPNLIKEQLVESFFKKSFNSALIKFNEWNTSNTWFWGAYM